MNINGIISQSGFEFQKRIFILNLLQLENSSFVVYEGQDDIEISNEYFPILSITPIWNETLIQVKSGNVTKQVLEKIFLNWILNFGNKKEYLCYLENPLDGNLNFKDPQFFEDLLNKISNSSNRRKDSILRRSYDLYSIDLRSFKSNLQYLIDNAKFRIYDKEQLLEDIKSIFIKNFSNDGSSEFTQNERFEEFNRIINYKLAEALYFKNKFKFNFSELFNLMSDIKSSISSTSYELNFLEFKMRKIEAVKQIVSSNKRSVRQLKLVNNTEDFIIEGLTQQIFYEDLRNYFVNIGEEKEILNIEYNANENFKDAKGELLADLGEYKPNQLYFKTIGKDIKSKLLKDDSGQYNHYKKGCYIHLTDDGIDKNILISWGNENE